MENILLVLDVFGSNVWIHGISLQGNVPNYVKLFRDLCFENEKWFKFEQRMINCSEKQITIFISGITHESYHNVKEIIC